MATEENFESRSHITKHLTGAQFDKTAERTRINSWPEQDYLLWKSFLHKTLGVGFYGQGVEIYESLKISKDGLSREEDVELGKRMYDEGRGKDVGWKVFQRVFGEKDDRVDKPE